jgi:LacI family transcriptional regulator
MATQHDIARSLGVSQTTVSLALRGHPSIPKATVRQVRRAARRLGYRPDPLVSALMAQRRTGKEVPLRAKIAFLTPFSTRSTWPSNYATGCFAGACAAATEHGYLCEAIPLWQPGIDGPRLSQILWTQNVQGLILAPIVPGDAPSMGLEWDRFAAVSLDYSMANPELHRIVDDHAFGIERVLDEVARLGYTRPGLVLRASQDVRTHHSRLGVFLVQCRLHPEWQTVPPLILPEDRWDEALFTAWLREERPDVVLTEENELPAAVRRLRVRVPRDLGIAFFHKERPARQLSGLQIDSNRVGAIAAVVLMRMIETNERGRPAIPTTTLVKSFTWHAGRTLRNIRVQG